jgi:hypothetical protein
VARADSGNGDAPGPAFDPVFARCDGGDTLATTAVLRGSFVTLLGCPTDDEAIVVVNERALCRLRFGSDEIEEIWRVR